MLHYNVSLLSNKNILLMVKRDQGLNVRMNQTAQTSHRKPAGISKKLFIQNILTLLFPFRKKKINQVYYSESKLWQHRSSHAVLLAPPSPALLLIQRDRTGGI